jgi:hypothetical protein
MKVFDTKKQLINLKGEVMKDGEEDASMGNIIANILCGQGIENPARAYQLGKKFSTEDTVELKAEDVVYLKKQLETASKFISALVLGQIITELDA